MVLYPYQQRVKDYIHAGKNVILQAPTGAGKTRAALAPFIEAFFDFPPERFPKKCIYAVPMRVLANQFRAEYAELANTYQRKHHRELKVCIQTGEHKQDPRFEKGNLIFATVDQVLSSFLLSPYSLPRRLSNFNAGAVAASYLVFDEFHLFDPISTLPTTLEMLKMLDGIAPFLLMTATFSPTMLAGLARELNAVVVPEDEKARGAMQALSSQQKTRRYHVQETLTAERILSTHQSRSLVVCNVVDRARALYEQLQQHPQLGDTRVHLLHSRFLQPDRQRKEQQVRDLFHRENKTGSHIVVATQVIEVGLDITSRTLHTELAPANAILQRAGRCARYANETGDVYVYTSALDPDGEIVDLTESAWPYQEQQKRYNLVDLTRQALQSIDGQSLTFSDEQDLIGQAHGKHDRAIVDGLVGQQEVYRRKMNAVMNGDKNESAASLIREIAAVNIVIHDAPDAVAQHPFAAESFSLHPGTLRGRVKRWQEAGLLTDGAVQILQDQGDKDENRRSAYTWYTVKNVGDLKGAFLVLLSPELAGYDAGLGLLLDRSTDYRAALSATTEQSSRGAYSYRLETYADHVQRVHRAFTREVWPELQTAAARLEHTCGWPAGIITQAAHLVVLWHDVGKLNQSWQQWVQTYQSKIGLPVPAGFYAHTDSDPTQPHHFAMQRQMPRRPSHAVEGATAVAPLLHQVLGACCPVFKAAFTAIARHHGAFTQAGSAYRLAHGADAAIAQTLDFGPAVLRDIVDVRTLWANEHPAKDTIQDFLISPARDCEFLAYVLLARALRRADQMGTQAGSAYQTVV